jgi:hypothetical protein
VGSLPQEDCRAPRVQMRLLRLPVGRGECPINPSPITSFSSPFHLSTRKGRDRRRYCAPVKRLDGRHRPNNSSVDLSVPPIRRESVLGILYPTNCPTAGRSTSRQPGTARRGHRGHQSAHLATSRSHSKQGGSRGHHHSNKREADEEGIHPPPYTRFDPSLHAYQFPAAGNKHHRRDERNVLR